MTAATCCNGHAMTPENTYVRKGKNPACRACNVTYQQTYRARRKAVEARGEDWSTRKERTAFQRLMARATELPNGCWEWTGADNGHGYGVTTFAGRRRMLVHRAFYELLVGPIPEGQVIDHVCHNRDESCAGGESCRHRRCVNPEHLEPTTPEENSSRGVHGRKRQCPRGHAYDPANTYINGGRRFCRACMHLRSAAYKARKAAAA